MRLAMIQVGDRSGSPLWPSSITSPQTEFFWSRKVREQKVAFWSCAADAVRRFKHCIPIHIWTSENQKGEVLDGLSVSKKKKARPIMSAMATVVGSLVFEAMAKMQQRTMIGTVLTLLGGGSFLEYAFSIRSKLKSV